MDRIGALQQATGRTRVPLSGVDDETQRIARRLLGGARGFVGADAPSVMRGDEFEGYRTGETAGMLSSLADVLPGVGALGGVIRPTGALTRLLKAMRPLDPEARAVGREFLGRAPGEYFERFTQPARTASEAMRQYGLDMTVEPHRNAVAFTPQGQGGGGHAAVLHNPASLLKLAEEYEDNPGIREYLRGLDPETALYEIDAMGTKPGSGIGQSTYPAIFDVMSGQKGLTNVPVELTAINQMRRSLNTADAMLRNPELTGRIVPHDEQLRRLGTAVTPSEFLSLPREEQIGAMQLSGALRGAHRLDQLRNRRDELERLMPAQARSLEALDRLSVDTPPEEFQRFRREHGAPLAVYGLGDTTLRKMGLIDAALAGRDVTGSGLWRGLGK